MKPKQAKSMMSDAHDDPISNAIESIWYSKKQMYWQALRLIVDGMIEAGYLVFITKDGKDYAK